MKTFILTLFFVFLSSNIYASKIIELAGQIHIPLPENWKMSDDSDEFPFQVIKKMM